MKIRPARHVIRLYMALLSLLTRRHIIGWASLWDTIYVLPGHERNRGLIAHETTHLDQMVRDGKLRFLIRYVYWTLRYGYERNPYEVEARHAQLRAVL